MDHIGIGLKFNVDRSIGLILQILGIGLIVDCRQWRSQDILCPENFWCHGPMPTNVDLCIVLQVVRLVINLA